MRIEGPEEDLNLQHISLKSSLQLQVFLLITSKRREKVFLKSESDSHVFQQHVLCEIQHAPVTSQMWSERNEEWTDLECLQNNSLMAKMQWRVRRHTRSPWNDIAYSINTVKSATWNGMGISQIFIHIRRLLYYLLLQLLLGASMTLYYFVYGLPFHLSFRH